LRTPVGARVLHALISATTSASVSTSGGRRRELEERAALELDAAVRLLAGLITRRRR
jgi:hypothetical protein